MRSGMQQCAEAGSRATGRALSAKRRGLKPRGALYGIDQHVSAWLSRAWLSRTTRNLGTNCQKLATKGIADDWH